MNDLIQLVDPLIPAMRRYARALTHDHAAADDLVQDALERAISRWGQRRRDGDARTWLFAILHNLAISRLRQAARRGRHVTLDDADVATLSTPAGQEHGVRHGELLRALDQLPEEQRSVLLLVSVEDLTYAQAAEVLGAPVGTVMSRLSRGRERLRRIMEGETLAQDDRPQLRRVK